DAVDRHQAARAVPRAAVEPAWTVVLERAREDLAARRRHRRPERVALEARHPPAVEEERDLARSVDPLALACRQPHFLPLHGDRPGSGRKTSSTSLLRASR